MSPSPVSNHPCSEVERIQDGDQVRMIRALDEMHDRSEGLGSDDGLSEDEMELLHETRPGALPWEQGKRRPARGR